MKLTKRGILGLLASLALLLIPSPVFANAGVPMIAVYLPTAWLLLLPVILIEGLLGERWLGIARRRAVMAELLANSASTLVGVPLTWAVLAAIEVRFFGTAEGLGAIGDRVYAVTIQAPWLIPYETDLWWMVPAAMIVLAGPFIAVSVTVEYLVLRRCFQDQPRGAVWLWAWRANLVSYALLLVCLAVAAVGPDAPAALRHFLEPIIWWLADLVFWAASLGEAA